MLPWYLLALLLNVGLTPVFLAEAYVCDRLFEYDATIRGEIKSPGYETGKYPEQSYCHYRIKAPQGHKVKLTFKDLDIDPIRNCATDRFEVEAGTRDKLFGTFCGDVIPYPIVTKDDNELLLTFAAEEAVSGRGFHVEYESGPDLEQCNAEEGECRNRNCYLKVKKCDGVDDCGDGTDEENCGYPVALPSPDKCGISYFTPNTIYNQQLDSLDRQVGGIPAVPNSWPWQVSLQNMIPELNAHYCGGTLISPEWVVTAAHCISSVKEPSKVRIVLGSYNKYKRTKYEVRRYAQRIIAYPDLEGNQLRFANDDEDIALIKLNAPVAFSDGIQPACLPTQGTELKTGTLCYSTGWGETRGTGFSDVLKQTEQVVQSEKNCVYIEETQVCVNQPFQSPCHGDSGGPLVCKFEDKWFLMGAVSFASAGNYMTGLCGTPESRVIFARVASKINWIRDTINKMS